MKNGQNYRVFHRYTLAPGKNSKFDKKSLCYEKGENREKHFTEKHTPPPPQAVYRQEIFFYFFWYLGRSGFWRGGGQKFGLFSKNGGRRLSSKKWGLRRVKTRFLGHFWKTENPEFWKSSANPLPSRGWPPKSASKAGGRHRRKMVKNRHFLLIFTPDLEGKKSHFGQKNPIFAILCIFCNFRFFQKWPRNRVF